MKFVSLSFVCIHRIFTMFLFFTTLLILGAANAAPPVPRAVAGSASFYGGNIDGGNCLLTGYTLPTGIGGTAYSGQVWNSAAMCGGCLSVTASNGVSVKVMVRCVVVIPLPQVYEARGLSVGIERLTHISP